MAVTGAPRLTRAVERAFSWSQSAMALILVAFIVGSLIFTGGQVGPRQSAPWDQVRAWPVFSVPAWVMIGLGVVGAITVIPLAVMTPIERVPRLLTAIAQAFAGGGAALLFAGMFPSDTGPIPMPGDSAAFLGAHWVATALCAFSIVVLIAALIVRVPAYERLRKSHGGTT